ncbi:hypothetical protein MRB53_005449 [Persea americana]|uniref:Uncharacterized protein n=1 Tax=Persea americana TaxID=3435 RepID=A0ACC2MEA1_PERAE|nr:hypothetical protein MRB53_005449 [Persea americana]
MYTSFSHRVLLRVLLPLPSLHKPLCVSHGAPAASAACVYLDTTVFGGPARRLDTTLKSWSRLQSQRFHPHEKTEKRVDVEPYAGEIVIDKNPGIREPITIGVIEHCLGGTEMEGESPVREESTANDGCFDLDPCVGMEFESAHAVYSYYNEYARRIGFGVTKKFTRKSKKDRTLIAGHYVCSKYGFKPEREKTDKSRRPRPVTRVGCKAMIKAKRKDSGKWEIFDVIKEHNHELSPGNVSFFRSHKKICKPQKNVTRNLHSSGKRKGKAFSVTVKHSGGVDNLSAIKDDRRNLIDRERQNFFPEEVAEAILNHFEAQADVETLCITPSLKTPSPFEKQAASVYTNEIFKKIQLEVLGMSACCISNVQQEGAITVYIVKEWEDFEMLKGKDYKVMWNGSEVRVSCICHLFEFKGFLCRHALVALITSGVPKIPSYYILKRWTKEMRNRHVLDDFLIEQACNGDRPKTMDQRYNDLCQRSFRFAEEGSLSEESYNIALYELQRAVQKLLIVNNSNGRLPQPREQLEKVASSPSNHCSTQESWQQMGQEVFEHMGACQPVYHTREFYQ